MGRGPLPLPSPYLAATPEAVRPIDLSVIVVNYNTGPLLERCVDSIRRFSDGIPLEILVVDNASTDGSADRLGRLSEIRLIRNRENLGFAQATNQGIEASRGRYLLLLNPDAYLVSPIFRSLIAFAEERRDAGVVGPRLRNPDGTLQPSAYRFPTLIQAAGAILSLKRGIPVARLRASLGWWLGRYFGQLDPHASVKPVDYVTGACMLIRRELVRQIGGLDPRFFLYFEEKDFCLRARQAGWEVYFCPHAEVVHQIGGSSGDDPGTTIVERFRAMRQFYDKHYGWGSRFALRGLLVAGASTRLTGAILSRDPKRARAWRTVLELALRRDASREGPVLAA